MRASSSIQTEHYIEKSTLHLQNIFISFILDLVPFSSIRKQNTIFCPCAVLGVNNEGVTLKPTSRALEFKTATGALRVGRAQRSGSSERHTHSSCTFICFSFLTVFQVETFIFIPNICMRKTSDQE